MLYMSIKDASKKWRITPRRIQVLCSEGRVKGAHKIGNMWVIPKDAEKPKELKRGVKPYHENRKEK